MASVRQKCCVFIDNSNLLIEGQKFYAHSKNLRASVTRDIRLRMDIGRMLCALLDGRECLFAKLYGSEPSPIDSIWQRIRSKEIEVHTFPWNSKNIEKEVDTAISVDVTEQSWELQGQEPVGCVTFIIVVSDRHYVPCCEQVLKRFWKLEIVAWKNCLTQEVKRYAEENQGRGVSLILLDNLDATFRNIYFLQGRWTVRKPLHRERTIVFQYGKPVEDKEAKQLNSDVTDLIRLPCWYIHRPENDVKVVMIVIIPDQTEGKYSTGELYEIIRAKFASRCEGIVDFFTFKQEQNPIWLSDTLFLFKQLEDEEETETSGEDEAKAA